MCSLLVSSRSCCCCCSSCSRSSSNCNCWSVACPRLRSATIRYVQVLLSTTSWVAAGADAAAATAAREIDHKAELELLATTAATTLGGRCSILLKEMMKILERQTTTTTTMSAICNSLNTPKDLLTYLLAYLLTYLLTYIHAV